MFQFGFIDAQVKLKSDVKILTIKQSWIEGIAIKKFEFLKLKRKVWKKSCRVIVDNSNIFHTKLFKNV